MLLHNKGGTTRNSRPWPTRSRGVFLW